MAGHLERIYESVMRYEGSAVKKLVTDALADGVDPLTIMDEALTKAIAEIGDKFGREEIFLPELMLGAKSCMEGMDVVKKRLAESKTELPKPKGVVVIGTVKGDIHNIGKDIVRILLETAGFEVHDIGVDASPESFVRKAREVGAQVVASSALLTTTCPFQKEIEVKLKEDGLRGTVKTIIGGAATSREWAREVGCDFYAATATEGVSLIRGALEGGGA